VGAHRYFRSPLKLVGAHRYFRSPLKLVGAHRYFDTIIQYQRPNSKQFLLFAHIINFSNASFLFIIFPSKISKGSKKAVAQYMLPNVV